MSSSSIDMSTSHYDMFIDGEIVSSSDDGYFESTNPSTGDVFATVTNATPQDMKKAVDAAYKSCRKGVWQKFSLAERGVYLKKIAQIIRENAKELAELESKDIGKTSKQSTFIDIPTCADTFDYFSNISNELAARENKVDAPVKSTTRFEPMGVAGLIIPWNYPLIMFAWKTAPALMAGNNVIIKPSPLGSVAIMRLAQLLKESSLPAGVLNIISTSNVESAAELVRSSKVNMISFTGSTETGKEIMKLAAENVKKVSLELGGKSANIVFGDCDMEAALGGTMSAIFMNQGQMCTAGSRLLLEDSIYDSFLQKLIERTQSFRIGPVSDYQTQFGPVISQGHRDKIKAFIKKGLEEGAELLYGGNILEGGAYGKGYFIEPAILGKVKNEMYVAQEEIFGPVLSVIRFKGVDEAVRLANDSRYGLAACIWTKDESKPKIVSEALECGTVWVNTYGGFYNEASFGGYKQSGSGRELGIEGLLEYTQSKNVCIDQTPGGKPLAASWF